MGTKDSGSAASGDEARRGAAQADEAAGSMAGMKAAEIVDRAAEGAHEAIDRLAQRAAPAAEQLQHRLEETGALLQEEAGRLRDMGREWREGLRSQVRAHPLATVAAALALGALLARLAR